ncbi:hypothetical protein FRC11_009380 [Ceratobasidium sp. 423]|nr:hypothetical protein FRC11_009380 [Ceratobasidium sp. 423]
MRQMETYHLAGIHEFIEIRPGGMIQPGTFTITPGHQPMIEQDEYGDTELEYESTYIPDYSMEDDYYYSETHKTINITPLVASIINPDPRQPPQSIEAFFMLQGVDTGSQVIQIQRSMVATVVELIRGRQSILENNAEFDREVRRIYADTQRSRATAAQAKQNYLAGKRGFERLRSVAATDAPNLLNTGALCIDSPTAHTNQLLGVTRQIANPSGPLKRKSRLE